MSLGEAPKHDDLFRSSTSYCAGLSETTISAREAVDRFAYDLRWKYAAGVDLDYPSFVHTVLVNMRARLRDSKRPDRTCVRLGRQACA